MSSEATNPAPNDGENPTTVDSPEQDQQTPHNADETDAANDDEEEAETPEEEAEEVSPEEVLHHAVCRALLGMKNKDFPLLVTTFYTKNVLPNRPEGSPPINLKATRYKKFGTYVKTQMERGLLHAGPDKKNPKNKDPIALLLGYTKKHEDFDSIDTSTPVSSSANEKAAKVVMVNLYVIPKHWQDLLRLEEDVVTAANATSEDRQGTGILTTTEVRNMVDEYIGRESLIPSDRKDQVQLDGPLTEVLYKKKKKKDGDESPPPERLTKKDLKTQLLAKCHPAYAFVQMPGSKIIKLARGTPAKIDMEVAMRQSKKYVTRVRGLEVYGIDPQTFAKDVSKRLACSVTSETQARPGKPALKAGHVELVFQGNLIEQLEALLVGDETLSKHGGVKDSDYRVPKQVLEIALRKGVPGRKKGGTRKGG